MKLHFYILEPENNNEFNFRYEECEVVEKPKSYLPANRWPEGIYNRWVPKSAVGGFLGVPSLLTRIVVLDEKNHEKAKELFTCKYNAKIRELERKLEREKAAKAAVEKFDEDTTP